MQSKIQNPKSKIAQSARRGLALVVAIVALFLVGVLTTESVRIALARHGQQQRAEHLLQAEWLAESGLNRAAAALRAQADYTGEIWAPAADLLGSRWPARVEIRVAPGPDAGSRRVRVVADYPPQTPQKCRVSKSVVVNAPQQ